MEVQEKSKEQLINEPVIMQQRIKELAMPEAEGKLAKLFSKAYSITHRLASVLPKTESCCMPISGSKNFQAIAKMNC